MLIVSQVYRIRRQRTSDVSTFHCVACARDCGHKLGERIMCLEANTSVIRSKHPRAYAVVRELYHVGDFVVTGHTCTARRACMVRTADSLVTHAEAVAFERSTRCMLPELRVP